ncbi:hypothetical protein [Pseudomonas reactans]|uniref:hypothetical protein n=1 Tax=Pseudomonas reactans TaxID=117680 RepID=UPI0015A1DFC3|nr:hypothetical protein [Pseudomonas reactans]NWA67715.1 hypothetical protein [Pseudomonas reactans]
MSNPLDEFHRLISLLNFADLAPDMSFDDFVNEAVRLGFNFSKDEVIKDLKRTYDNSEKMPEWLNLRVKDLQAGPNWKD